MGNEELLSFHWWWSSAAAGKAANQLHHLVL
jgi:hypothetical protein